MFGADDIFGSAAPLGGGTTDDIFGAPPPASAAPPRAAAGTLTRSHIAHTLTGDFLCCAAPAPVVAPSTAAAGDDHVNSSPTGAPAGEAAAPRPVCNVLLVYNLFFSLNLLSLIV